jgi:hypothetical protein
LKQILLYGNLLKLPNGKTKSVIIEENDKFKELGLDDSWKIPTKNDQDIIAIRQTIVDSLEIFEGFPKKMWDHYKFIKEH